MARTVFDRGEGIGYRHAQIVVAVDADNGVSTVGYLIEDSGDQRPKLLGHGITHGVGDVDRRRPRRDGRRDDFVEIVRLSAGSVHGRKLDIVAVRLGLLHCRHRHFQHLFSALAQLAREVNIRRANKGVNPRPRRVSERLAGPLDVLGHGAGQPANYRPGNFLPNAAHGLKVLVGGHWKAGLDNIDLQPRQLVGDFQLFPHGQRGTGRLLGVPQRGVENIYAICFSHDVFFPGWPDEVVQAADGPLQPCRDRLPTKGRGRNSTR